MLVAYVAELGNPFANPLAAAIPLLPALNGPFAVAVGVSLE